MTAQRSVHTPLTLGRETVRKALHLTLAPLPVLYSIGLSRDVVVVLLASGTLVFLLLEVARGFSPRARAAFDHAFATLLRGHERAGILGGTWLLATCLITVLVLPREAAVAALWCAAVGDPVAALVGRAVGALRGRTAASEKTAAGSAACFLASLVGVWKLAHFPASASTIVALVATLVERLPLPGDDNVRVPVAAGGTAWLLS